MEIPTRNEQGVTILEARGSMTIGKGDLALRHAVENAVGAGARNFLVNMSKLRRMDSSGLGELIAAKKAVDALGGTLKVAALPSRVEQVLSVTQLMSVFEVFDDEASALESFK